MTNSPPPAPSGASPAPSAGTGMDRWIRTACGRAKYAELAARPGALARVRLAWFVLIAALRDWRVP